MCLGLNREVMYPYFEFLQRFPNIQLIFPFTSLMFQNTVFR